MYRRPGAPRLSCGYGSDEKDEEEGGVHDDLK